MTVRSLKCRYNGDVGDVVIGRVLEVDSVIKAEANVVLDKLEKVENRFEFQARCKLTFILNSFTGCHPSKLMDFDKSFIFLETKIRV